MQTIQLSTRFSPISIKCLTTQLNRKLVLWRHFGDKTIFMSKTFQYSEDVPWKLLKTKLNSVALVRERTIPTERPPPVGEVSANFCGYRGVTWLAQRVPTAVKSLFSEPGAATFYSSSSSIWPHEAEWTPFQTHYYSENLVAPGIEPGTSVSVARNSDH